MKKIFEKERFCPTGFSTIEDKAKFANQFVKFVESDFSRSRFPKWFYSRLSNTFGHIAHYNEAGFYEAFFTSPKGKVDFIEACLSWECFGDPAFTYSDVERELKNWLINNSVLDGLREKFIKAVNDIEKAWLTAAQYRSQLKR